MHRILFVTLEVYPLVKTGGLADYSGALTKVLACRGHDVKVLLPAYRGVTDHLSGSVTRTELGDVFDATPVALVCARLPGGDVDAWLIDCPALFDRDGGIYQDASGSDWPDNPRRFGVLSRVAASLALGRGPDRWRPDVVHLNEWQSGPQRRCFSGNAMRRQLCSAFTTWRSRVCSSRTRSNGLACRSRCSSLTRSSSSASFLT